MSIKTIVEPEYILNIVSKEETSISILNYISANLDNWENTNILWDLREFNFLPINPKSIRQYLDSGLPRLDKRAGTKSAVVVKSKLAYGFLRMIQLITEYKIDIEMAVFQNIDEAINWLKNKKSKTAN